VGLAQGLHVLGSEGVGGEEGEGEGLGQQVVVHIYVLDADGADGKGWKGRERGREGGREGGRGGKWVSK